jgi:hypothetical protein
MSFLSNLLRPRQRTPADLARWLDLPEADLRAWLSPSPAWARGYDYRRFSLPKRRGGWRQIEAPGDKLKLLQRRVLRRLLAGLPPHPAATGFTRGRSIVDNARPHAGQAVVINLDLSDFFASITAERVAECFRGLGWGEAAATILSRICTSEGRLPQGAPTSPAVSNLACRRLDARLGALAARFGGRYTRYADDITFSLPAFGRNRRLRRWSRRGPGRPRPPRAPSRSLLTLIRAIVEAEGFRIQMRKRVRVLRRHQRQTATGLVLNARVNLPRRTRRLIRAMQHHERLGRLDEAGRRRLRGLEALRSMVERQR